MKTKIKILFIVLLFVSFNYAISQNLLLNPDFEIAQTGGLAPSCPNNNKIINCANWGGLRWESNLGANGYFNTTNCQIQYCTPVTINNGCADNNGAHQGSSFIRIEFNTYMCPTHNNKKRELAIQTVQLDANKTYKIIGWFQQKLSNSTNSCGGSGQPTTIANRELGFQLIPTSVGTTPQQIFDASMYNQNYRFEPQIIGSVGINLYYPVTYYFKPTTTGSYYLLVGSFDYLRDMFDVETSFCFIDDLSLTESCTLPTPNITTNRTNICPNQDATLTYNNGTGVSSNISRQWQKTACSAGGVWSDIAGATGNSVVLTSQMLGSSYYKIRLKLTPCASGSPTYSNEIVIMSVTGCQQSLLPCFAWGGGDRIAATHNTENSNPIINIYPNPSSGELTLSLQLENESRGILEIFDATGKVAEKIEITDKNSEHQISLNIPNGIYFYRLMVNDEIVKTDKISIIK